MKDFSFEPSIDHLKVLGTQIQWRPAKDAEAGTVLLMPRKDGPPVHFHPRQQEEFLVRQGELQVFRNKEWVTLREGEKIQIPRRTPHTYRNISGDVVLFDFCISPKVRFTEMIEEMDGLVRQGKIKGQDIRSVMYLSRVMAAYPDVTQSVKPPQFIIRTMAILGKLFLK